MPTPPGKRRSRARGTGLPSYAAGMSIPRPVRRAVGHLDEVRRTAILTKAQTLVLDRRDARISEHLIVRAWTEAEFLTDVSTALAETAQRYGMEPHALQERVSGQAAELVARGLYDDDVTSLHQTYATQADKYRSAMVDHGRRLALLAIPDPEFLTAIEHTVAAHAGLNKTARRSCEALVRYADAAMRAHAVPFAANPDGRTFRWTGDRVLHDTAITPALRALADPRLTVARDEFGDALVKRRSGRASDMRDAVHEAANAVESVMEVLLVEHQIPQPGKQTAVARFNRLTDPTARTAGALLPGHIQQLVLAAAEIRNHEGGHTQGATISTPTPAMADAAIGAAASAITVLATYL